MTDEEKGAAVVFALAADATCACCGKRYDSSSERGAQSAGPFCSETCEDEALWGGNYSQEYDDGDGGNF